MEKKTNEDLVAEVQELRSQLEEAQDTLDAIRRGEVDGLVVSTPKGEQVYTISGAERPYRALIEDMREGAVMLSDDNGVLYCNSGFAKMMKLPMERIVGVNIESMVCSTHKIALKKLLSLARAQKGAVTKEITLLAKDNVLVPTLMSVNSLQSDTLKNTFLVVTDLSEHMEEEVNRYTNELELAQIALSESEQRWATTLASIGDAVIATDMLGKIKFMNGAAEKLTGWTLNEASGRKVQEIFKIVNEFTRKNVDDPVTKVLEKGMILGLANHTILIRKDKTEVAIDDSGAPIKDKAGKISGVVLIFRDISARRTAEKALDHQKAVTQQERDRISSLLNSITDEVWFADRQKKFVLANPSAAREFKLDVSAKSVEVENLAASLEVYRSDGSVRPVEEAPSLRALKGEVIKNQEEIIKTPATGELRTRQVSSAPVRDTNGAIIGSVSVVRDVTEQKKAQEALKESEHLYRTVFDNSQDGFQLIELIYDENRKPIDHKFLKVNQAYEKIIGVKAKDILDKSAKYISPNLELHWLEVPDRVAKTGISEHVELYNKDINKTLDCYYFLYSNNVVGTLFRDITERKRIEKQLQDSERLAAIGATAGMVGHDIRNPLQAIMGDLYIAREEIKEMPNGEGKRAMQEAVTEIEKNIDYINKIVADLQDYARPLNPHPGEADLKLIIEKLLQKNGVPENVKVSVKVQDEARKFVADADYLNRILYNLVTNAIQAMPKGGKLTIHVYKESNEIILVVKDTGVGIPTEIQGKMFTPLFTTKSKGQGFGLPVVKRMTESLGGTISFESEEGKGTTFTLRLPPPRAKR